MRRKSVLAFRQSINLNGVENGKIKMGTRKSLVVIRHDDGYGDALLTHLNILMSGRDMIAENVYAMSSDSDRSAAYAAHLKALDPSKIINCELCPCGMNTTTGQTEACMSLRRTSTSAGVYSIDDIANDLAFALGDLVTPSTIQRLTRSQVADFVKPFLVIAAKLCHTLAAEHPLGEQDEASAKGHRGESV